MKTIASRVPVLVLVLALNFSGPLSSIASSICHPKGVSATSFSTLSAEAAAADLPYTFFFTHYEFIGDLANPEGVTYSSNGKPSAKAADGSVITMTGQGAWEPGSKRAEGGGQYTLKDVAGAVKAQGSWRVTQFISFDLLPLDDWWGLPGFREEGWQGGPDSVSFSGFLTVNVKLDTLGDAVLRAWCLMPSVSMSDTHVGDGISLLGDNFDFGGSVQGEMNMFQNSEGVMFYSTDPNAGGWVQTPTGVSVSNDQGLKSFEAPSAPNNKGYNPK